MRRSTSVVRYANGDKNKTRANERRVKSSNKRTAYSRIREGLNVMYSSTGRGEASVFIQHTRANMFQIILAVYDFLRVRAIHRAPFPRSFYHVNQRVHIADRRSQRRAAFRQIRQRTDSRPTHRAATRRRF